jgi:uncharacterized membrane-anchored protein YitT (DUF2179 family)
MRKQSKKQRLLREIHHLAGIILGAVFFAIGYSWFLLPYNMAPGGVGGLSQIVNYYTGIPNGVSMILINLPLFVISFVFIGRSFGAKSLYGMFVTAIMTDLLNLRTLARFGWVDLAQYTHLVNGRTVYALLGPGDMMLSAIAGSVMLGLGLGIIFKARGSTGGTDIPVALIKQKAGLSIGTGYYIVETGIILAVALFLRDPKILIWGYINLFITTKITDLASEGLPYIKGVYIISNGVDEIKEEIYEKLDRGVTYFKALGGYEKKEIDVLFCVMNRRQVPQLTDIVKDIDPDAFMIVTDVYDVLGYGFKSRKIDLAG